MAYYSEGNYDCRIVGQFFGESEKKGTPFFGLRFYPQEGVHEDQTMDGEHEREVRLYLTDATVERHIAWLQTLGWDGRSFTELEPGGLEFSGFVRLRCVHEHRNDKVYEKWEVPLSSGERTEHVEGIAKRMDALFGKCLAKGKSKHETAEPRSLPPLEDDPDVNAQEVPF